MDCACVYVDEYSSPLDFYSEKINTAYKKHKCSECGRVINPGEKYERVAGKWDGDFSTYKTCQDCLSLRETFFCRGYAFSWLWHDFREFVADCGGEINFSDISKLSPRAREKVCDMLEEYWENQDY